MTIQFHLSLGCISSSDSANKASRVIWTTSFSNPDQGQLLLRATNFGAVSCGNEARVWFIRPGRQSTGILSQLAGWKVLICRPVLRAHRLKVRISRAHISAPSLPQLTMVSLFSFSSSVF